MQNSNETHETGLLPLAVPPPPPPPPKFSLSVQNCNCKYAYAKETKLPKKSPKEDVISAVRHITHNFYVDYPSNLISLYFPISPIIQQGRCCGIVALSMASQLINNVPVDEILDLAKSLNFTKEGEMFSAYNMAMLAETLLHCDAVVIDNLDAHKEDLLNHICDGWPLLIPYDADRNHFPCSNNGITAHWAVITGVAFTFVDKNVKNTMKNFESIQEYPELDIFIVEDKLLAKHLLKYSKEIFLYAHQGKSKHLAAWNLNELIKSNKNMYEITKKYSSDDLILPSGDSLSELRNKVVLLKKGN